MKVVPLRLQPGDDLRQALETWMGELQVVLLTIDSGREAERPKGSTKTPLHHPGFSVQLRFAPAP